MRRPTREGVFKFDRIAVDVIRPFNTAKDMIDRAFRNAILDANHCEASSHCSSQIVNTPRRWTSLKVVNHKGGHFPIQYFRGFAEPTWRRFASKHKIKIGLDTVQNFFEFIANIDGVGFAGLRALRFLSSKCGRFGQVLPMSCQRLRSIARRSIAGS